MSVCVRECVCVCVCVRECGVCASDKAIASTRMGGVGGFLCEAGKGQAGRPVC